MNDPYIDIPPDKIMQMEVEITKSGLEITYLTRKQVEEKEKGYNLGINKNNQNRTF
ncbi:MAG: hypothetical protein WC390_06750 [Sulfurimonas sp.]|jgi:hypothetical protein